MRKSGVISAYRDPLSLLTSVRFSGRHILIVGPLCLATAIGRFVQTGYPGLDFTVAQVLLEILVEGGRIALAVLVVGAGGLTAGVRSIKWFFRMPEAERNARFTALKERVRCNGVALAADLVGYLIAAAGMNLAIGFVAELPSVVNSVAALGANPTSGTAATLLLKNLTVIPFTIVFQVHFAAGLWLSPEERTHWLDRRRRNA